MDPQDRPELENLDRALERAYGGLAVTCETSQVLPFLSSEGAAPTPVTLREDPAPAPPLVVRRSGAEGRYQLDGTIGEGGMGIVLRGNDLDLGREVAVKMIREEYAENREVVRRFVEEAQIEAQLQHPGIVPVYEIGLTRRRRPFFAMRLIRGRTLASLLAERRDPADDQSRLLGIFESVCQTVAYAHARGVIHRDLKPANVMVGAYGEVLVVDWGLGKILARPEAASPSGPPADAASAGPSPLDPVRSVGDGPVSRAGSVLGTLCYMPPEQARGASALVDERADVFALGGLLCEILTGRPPYGAAPDVGTCMQAVRGELGDAYARLERCVADRGFVRIARACLSAEPADRPRHAGEVAASIAAVRAEIEARARRAETEAAEARILVAEERRRRRLSVWLSAALAGLVATGAGGWVIVTGERRARTEEIGAQVTAALDEASRLRAEAIAAPVDAAIPGWQAAHAVAARARGLADADGAPSGGTDRVAAVLAELEVGERAARERAALRAREESTRARLERVEALRFATGDLVKTADRYAEAFASHFGPAWQGLSPEEAGRAVRDSGIRDELAITLESWIFAVQDAKRDPGWLVAVLDLADPDPFRRRLREVATELDGLRRLAGEADLASVRIRSVRRLANRLGHAGDVPRARAIAAEAWRRDPSDFWSSYWCAWWASSGPSPRLEDADRYYVAAIATHPRSVIAWNNLGAVRVQRRRLRGALEAFEEAIRLYPDEMNVRVNMATIRTFLGDPAGAERILRAAILHDPEFLQARYNLGNMLRDRGDFAAALASYDAAVAHAPDDPEVRCNRAYALLDLGRLEEGLAEMRRGHALGSKQPGWRYPSEAWVRRAESLTKGASRLEAVLDGGARPDSVQEAAVLAQVALAKGRHAEAARLFAEAFASEPERLGAPGGPFKWMAVRASVRAGAGGAGAGAAAAEADRSPFRRQGLAWMREILAWQAARAGDDAAAVPQALGPWKLHRDLEGVRGAALATLPPDEREAWTALWKDVDATIASHQPVE